jgi:hypothetical protein
VLALIVNHTSDRSYPFRIMVTDPERGSRMMNVCMYDNVQVFQQGHEVTVKILHRGKGEADSACRRISKYSLVLQSVNDATLFYDTVFPPKEDV